MTCAAPARRLVLVLLVVAATSGHTPALAQSDLAYSVKANYLVRFTAFVDWPGSVFGGGTAPISICVLGPDPFGVTLDQAASGQTAHGRPLVVRRPSSMAAAGGCHIIYTSADMSQAEAPFGALTVTDSIAATGRGAVHFVISDGRVRFHIDMRAARRAGVTLNSRLLNLALSVQGARR